MNHIQALTVVAALSFAGPAIGQTAPQSGPGDAAQISAVRCAAGTSATTSEAEHSRILNSALEDFGRSGFAGLRSHVPDLRRAFEAAPACYPKIEQRDRQTLVRAISTEEYLLIRGLLSTAQQSSQTVGAADSIVMQANTYGTLALMLGSAAVEDHQYADALTFLDRGITLQPHNELLLSEKVAALQGLGRNADALAVLDFMLNDGELRFTADRSRTLRLKGVVLIDLQRLDEAEEALNESIKLNDDNPVARNELAYISQLRANGPRRDLEITAPNAPRPN